MTVSSIEPVNNYAGNSSDTIFDFDFLIENESELIVQHTNSSGGVTILTNGVDYSINEIGNPNGSYITFPLAGSSYNVLAEDERISLILTLVIQQENEIKNSLYFNFNTLEWMFDYIVRILQILKRKIELCVKVNEGASQSADDLIKALNQSQINAEISANNAANSAQAAAISNTNVSNIYSSIQTLENTVTREITDGLSSISSLLSASLSEMYSKAEELGRTYLDKANDNAVVHLTGNETIAGEKTFTNTISEVNDIAAIKLRSTNTDTDWTQTPSINAVTGDISFYDKNNVYMTAINTYMQQDGKKGILIEAKNPATSSYSFIRAGFTSSNTPYTEAPACDLVDSIVTTLGISKSENGYVKLGNGIIIQWGFTSSQGANTHQTVTLPIAFSTLSYRVLTTFFGGGDVDDNAIVISQTYGDFVIYRTQVGANDNPWSLSVSWIAIGW